LEFSFEPSQAKTPRSLNSSSTLSSNERLQRAIERNRAKQAKRQMATASTTSSRRTTSPQPSSIEERKRALQAKLQRTMQLEAEKEVITAPVKKISTTRRSVAKSGTVSFSSTPRKSKLTAPVKYLGPNRKTAKKATSKVAKKSSLLDHLVIMGWIAIAILTARLLFSDRGVFDYYAHKDKLNQINHERELVLQNNQELLHEIKLIESNAKYQKKIVRDNLGFIAKSEYLILFAKQRAPANTN
jgi:hypothetical protein